jgi:hypothetical protein
MHSDSPHSAVATVPTRRSTGVYDEYGDLIDVDSSGIPDLN